MSRFGRADKAVMAVVHEIRKLAKILGNLVGEALRIDAGGLRRFFDFLAVLVRAGQEKYVEPVEPLESRQHVAGERGVRVADMRCIVDVIDRRREIIGLLTGHSDFPE